MHCRSFRVGIQKEEILLGQFKHQWRTFPIPGQRIGESHSV